MMLVSDGSFDVRSGGDYASGGGVDSVAGNFTMTGDDDDDDFNMSIDLDSFYSILGEDPDAQQLSPEDPSFQNVLQGDLASVAANHENILLTKASEYTTWNAKTLFESDRNCGKLEHSTQFDSSLEMNCSETQSEIPDCSSVGFPAGGVNHAPVYPLNADPNYVREDVNSNYTSYCPSGEPLDIIKGNYGISSDYQMDFGAQGMDSSSNSAHNETIFFQGSDNICSNFSPDMQYSMCVDDVPFDEPYDSHCLQFIPMNEPAIMDEKKFSTGNAISNTKMISKDQIGIPARHVPHMSAIDYYNSKAFSFKDGKYISPLSENCLYVGPVEPSIQSLSCTPNQKQAPSVKKGGMNGSITANSSTEFMGKTVISSFTPETDDISCMNKDLKQSFPSHQPQFSSMKQGICTKNEKMDVQFPSMRDVHSEVSIKETVNRNLADREWIAVQKSTSMMKQLNHIKNENDRKMIQLMGSRLFKSSRLSTESIQTSPLIGDNTDMCSLEDICKPPHPIPSLVQNSHVATNHSQLYDPLSLNGGGGQRPKTNDESNILQVALQDLSQPKAEASPPEGLLAVSLLRHQKIALSWMVQKETASLSCSGGILADDQGLGKTISTISLILTERSPSSEAYQKCLELGKPETLNLEDDDDLELDNTQISDASLQSRGRPAAGTLVVCPTSVLRQWAEELHNKVTRKANLSVLVYHGSNRTKDPCELAKYDVVITTYSIVSMEVPKQSLVDKDDDKRKNQDACVVQSMGLASSKKRKYPPSSYSRGSKEKKGIDKALLESAARPLAKVGWFRVVLDEAQSIKNHRTQVARACWGLRAKRRWCLSGTPIQNSIDDLYSYFRFLRYDPYAIYTSFCSKIKLPVSKNPANGYRKLQAVLKTIMLRRTKGTLLDGEPIINLPPKSIELKKVDFSVEERDFYFRLEADSRAQFEEYAAAGTVKQNYVNILLMLLRLRQACDHPLLVKGCNPKSILKSSVEIAKKLPHDKKTCLLTCLEASLALCGICNDPPEDAVVSICGHVFCNQCICEHLTDDDNKCPNTNCKVQLNVSSVFSKSTLNCSLDGQSGFERFEALEPCFEGPSFSSSKIKAALEVLQSLSKPQYDTSRSSSLRTFDETTSCSEVSSELWEVHKDMSDKGHIGVELDNGLNASIKVEGEKAIVFSQWTRMLDLLEACLKNSSIQYRRLDGTMSILSRDKAVKDFNTLPEVTVMIMSLKAASLGLNMVAACHVVMLDLWWNPTTEDQAIDRAHRIGQTRPVSVVRLTVKDTVEDRILALQHKKREMVASAFGEDETGSRQTRLTVDDLKYLFMA